MRQNDTQEKKEISSDFFVQIVHNKLTVKYIMYMRICTFLICN